MNKDRPTYQKIGDALGVTKQRASQLMKAGKLTIRKRGGKFYVTRSGVRVRNYKRVYTVDDTPAVAGENPVAESPSGNALG